MKNEKKETLIESKYSIISNYRYSLNFLKKYNASSYYILSIVFITLSIVYPFLTMAYPSAVVSLLLGEKKPEHILLLILGFAFILQIIQLVRTYTGEKIASLLFLFRLDFAKELYIHLLSMDYACLESTLGQKKMTKATQAVYSGKNTGIEAFLNQISKIFINVFGLIVYSIVSGRENIWILIIILLSTFIISMMNFRAGKIEKQYKEGQSSVLLKLQYLCSQTIAVKNGKDIRLYHMKEWFMDAFRNVKSDYMYFAKKIQKGYFEAKSVDRILALLRDIVVYGYFINQMVKGHIDIATFILYIGTAAGFGTWMNGIFQAVSEMIRNGIVMNHYRDFMEYGLVKDTNKSEHITSMGKAHEIRLEQVSFKYPGTDEYTLKDLNLTIRTGEKLALVGGNGAGKSTLIKLICGFYKPTHGKIYMDGINIENIPLKEYFNEFAVVFQDVFAFSFPLADNITCKAENEQDIKRMEESIRKADFSERVARLPKGTKTMMNKDIYEDGMVLSGGEMQKLMLSRALYKDAPMIILDEPTAALDPIAESNMYEKYNSLTENKTSIFISHRLSSTRFCDRIIFMKNGQIVEEGSHNDLMNLKKEYANMFDIQAHYYKLKDGEEKINE